MIRTITSLAAAVATLAGAASSQALVNAPVAPEAIYIGLGGATPGIAVMDLNGFGQGTGDPTRTHFPFNPNIGQPGVVPTLAPGSSSLDAGGAGPLTLTENTAGSTLLADSSTVQSVDDLQVGQPLDLVYNNENINVYANRANQLNPFLAIQQSGNSISVAPHPNPPRLVVPAPNPLVGIDGEEPTVTSSVGPVNLVTTTSPPCLPSPLNLLNVGNSAVRGVFYGPQPAPPVPPPPPPFCPFTSRQQIGHFLYALDRANQQVVVLNSNRFTTLATIGFDTPVDIALSPNLRYLAVAETVQGRISFLDVDPRSPFFHNVIAQTQVAPGIEQMAWQPDGEALLVCNPTASSLSIVRADDFSLQRVITRKLSQPIAIAVTAREYQFGADTWAYLAYLLNSDGTVSIYESGPTNAGADDIIARVGTFRRARSIHAELGRLGSGVWIGHEDSNGLGQLSLLRASTQRIGPRFSRDFVVDRGFRVERTIGGLNPRRPTGDLLSGNAVVDIVFDDVENVGALPDPFLPFSMAGQAQHSSKGHVRPATTMLQPAVTPTYVIIALGDVGAVDVFDLATGRKVTTVPAPSVRSLGSYWRQ